MTKTSTRLFRRKIFYISGFDPRGARYIHGNCMREAGKWAELTRQIVTVGSRHRQADNLVQNWSITAISQGNRVETEFSFLHWDNIIRSNWPRSELRASLHAFALLLRAIQTGLLMRIVKTSWPFAITMITSSGWMLLALLVLVLTGASLIAYWMSPSGPGIWWGLALATGCAAMIGWGLHNLERFKPGWTGRIGIFTHQFVFRRVPDLDARLDGFAEHIIAAADLNECDEILIVGHSFGTALATLVTARIFARAPHLGAAGSKLKLVTLGQIQSLAAYMPDAEWFRAEIASLARFPAFTWYDFSSPPDGACFALVNILDFLTDPPQSLPRLLNAQFHKTFSTQTMDRARRHRMEMHFLYLKSPDKPQPHSEVYDFIAMIAGPKTLNERFAARRSGESFFPNRARQ